MSSLPILRRRRERRLNERRRSDSRLTRGFLSTGLLLAMLLAALIIGGAFGYASVTADLPSIDLLPALLDPPNGALLQPSRVYDRTGEHLLAVLAPQDGPRNYLPLDPSATEHIPDALVRATQAVAEPDFQTSPGFSVRGLSDPNAHPTLAQSLAADLLLWNEKPDLRRAIRERILAAQITARFGRSKVMEWYLNSANYGHFAYGADAASRLYFSKPLSQVNLAEAALLAAVGQAPAINPLDAPQAAIQRQQQTLDTMQSLGLITPQETSLARFVPLDFQQGSPPQEVAPAFTALALSQLGSRVDRERIESGGMRVITTLDYTLQLQADCAIKTQVARLAGQNIDPCDGAGALPALPPGLNTPEASASAVVIDPHTGQILAAVGETHQGQESAFLTVHRPGTILTPFIYLAGFTRGLSPASLVWDIPSDSVTIPNPDGKFHGPLRLRTALTNDYLVPVEQVFTQMGAPLVARTLHPFGLDLSAASARELLDGSTRFSLLDMAQAYGIFAAQGARVGQPGSSAGGDQLGASAVLRVEGADRRLYLDYGQPQTAQVLSPQLSYLITDMLSHPGPLAIGIPAAVKAGQSIDGQETWTVGYTPERVVVAWVGSGTAPTPRAAAGLWTALMQDASAGVPPDDWTQPAGVVRLQVCEPSGLLPTPACPNQVQEVFLDGYQPTQADTLYQTYPINRETGLLATVFTAPQLVENRVYMIVPAQAQEWAKAAKLPVPPNTYDTIQQPPPDADAHISSPAMFAELQGKVTVSGTAAGSDFAYYRLQYGQGLNPQNWVQIGSDSKTPVNEAALAEWDTSGLNGLYALQLLVVHQDNSITTATVQVMMK